MTTIGPAPLPEPNHRNLKVRVSLEPERAAAVRAAEGRVPVLVGVRDALGRAAVRERMVTL